MKFTKKLITIEAEQFHPLVKPWPKGVRRNARKCWSDSGEQYIAYGIETREGWTEVAPGDWIITGVKGERYPCKPDIFKRTYDPAPPSTDSSDD